MREIDGQFILIAQEAPIIFRTRVSEKGIKLVFLSEWEDEYCSSLDTLAYLDQTENRKT